MNRKRWVKDLGIAVFGAAFSVIAQGQGMTPYAYVELTKQTMELKIEHLNQLVTEIASFGGDADAWISNEAGFNAGFDASYEAIYANFGVSDQDFLLYYGANEADVRSYLDAHPDDKLRIQDLEAQISGALEQYEQLKIELLELEPVLPADGPLPGV
jgi:hypothetical protein